MIEAKIDALIKALDANTAALLAASGKQPAPAAASAAQKAPPTNPASDRVAQSPQTTPQATALAYEKDVKPLALKLVNAPAPAAGQKTGRERMVELLKKYSVRLASEIGVDKLADFVKDVQGELAALGVK